VGLADTPMTEAMDFSSPRVRAAMTILGVTERDLTKLPDSAADSWANDYELMEPNRELALQRVETRNRKVEELTSEVSKFCALLSEQEVEQMLKDPEEETSILLEHLNESRRGLMDTEFQKLARLKEKTKESVMKVVQQELDTKKAQQDRKKKLEEEEMRLRALKVDKEKAIVIRKDKAAKEREKREAQFQKTAEEMREHTKGLLAKLSASEQRAASKATEKAALLRQQNHEAQKRAEETYERRLNNLAQERQHREKLCYAQRQRDVEIHERLEELNRSNLESAEMTRHEFQRKIQTAQERLAQIQAEKEVKLKESAQNLDFRRDAGRVVMEDKVKKVRQKREAFAVKVRENRERTKEREKEEQKTRPNYHSTLEQKAQNRDLMLHATVQKQQAGAHIVTEIVQMNKERLERAQEHSRKVIIANMKAKSARVDNLKKLKQEVQDQRLQTVKNAMEEKEALKMKLSTVRDASPKRINKMLKEYDLPLLGGKQENENAEEERERR